MTLTLTRLFPFALALTCGCHSLTPAQQAKVEKFDCQVRALAPLVEPALDAAELARDLYAGKGDLGRVLGSLNATQAEVDALVEALRACETAALPVREPPPEYTPSVLRAPPPAYGNKVL